jgi:co-chaperonin GroES (HSP10)
MKKCLPERGRLLLELEPVKEKTVAEGKTEDGREYKILAPEKHRERTRRGVILAVGKPAIPEDEGRFAVGDKIMISFFTGMAGLIIDYELGWLDDCHRVVMYDAILCKLIG